MGPLCIRLSSSTHAHLLLWRQLCERRVVTFRFDRVHITGAAGSGTTTLGLALAERLGVRHIESDDIAWFATDPPFQQRRGPAERAAAFEAAARGAARWVLSGAILRWTDGPDIAFDLVVFLHIPETVRLARLAARERARYGDAIDPGGAQYESHEAFMRLARGYESGAAPVNNLEGARAWLARQTCPVLQIEGAAPLAESLETVLRFGGGR
jgi:adenylate kinase family enzyme